MLQGQFPKASRTFSIFSVFRVILVRGIESGLGAIIYSVG